MDEEEVHVGVRVVDEGGLLLTLAGSFLLVTESLDPRMESPTL